MNIIHTGKNISRTLKMTKRMRKIVSVLAHHGFHQFIEKMHFHRLSIKKSTRTKNLKSYSIAERLRMSFEELGPTFIKLGQILATRSDLIPEEFTKEFSKLQDNVPPMPFDEVQKILQKEFNSVEDIFLNIDENPAGSASIAQVHRARLKKNNKKVVIKVQKPQVVKQILEDLITLETLAELLQKYVPETESWNPINVICELAKMLKMETNFLIEANNIRRFQKSFAEDKAIKIPEVYLNYSHRNILIMEAISGMPMSSPKEKIIAQHEDNIPNIVIHLLQSYLKMVFRDGLFHGDLHPGNIFLTPEGNLALIDFGIVGHLNKTTQNAIINMFVAMANEDYERLAYEYIDLAPFDERTNPQSFSRDLQNLVSPYYGLPLKHIDIGHILMRSASIANKHWLRPPAELMLFFKSLFHIENLGKKLKEDFDFLDECLYFSKTLFKSRYNTQQLFQDTESVLRDSASFFYKLPRQLKFFIRKWSQPNYAFNIHLKELTSLRLSLERSSKLLFLGLIIGSLILGASLTSISLGSPQTKMNSITLIGYSLAGFLSLLAFLNYIKK